MHVEEEPQEVKSADIYPDEDENFVWIRSEHLRDPWASISLDATQQCLVAVREYLDAFLLKLPGQCPLKYRSRTFSLRCRRRSKNTGDPLNPPIDLHSTCISPGYNLTYGQLTTVTKRR